MANFKGNTISTHKDDVREVFAVFYPAGTSNAALTFSGSGVASIARNATAGEFLVTLEDAWLASQLCGQEGAVGMASATDLKVQFATFTDGSSTGPMTFLLRTLAVATPTDIAADANNRVGFTLKFNNNPMV